MTAGTGVMRFRGSTHQGIIMAVGTAGRTHRDARMAWIRCMGHLPGASMTGCTVGRCRIADG